VLTFGVVHSPRHAIEAGWPRPKGSLRSTRARQRRRRRRQQTSRPSPELAQPVL